MAKQNVITYRQAYVGGQVTLCSAHRRTWEHPLGDVQHGEHWGICDVCLEERGEWRDLDERYIDRCNAGAR